ncbi:MAG: DUF1850 domain-containing protein [Deltaproteobacteria bacterium]|nr:DUF1850 domain-containing protein [Deltaproteobacteria bacterium]
MARRLPLLLLIAAGGAYLFWPASALEFENAGRGIVTRYPVHPGDAFSVTYLHSIYRRPVVEEFSVGKGGDLVLTGVRSESGAVLEYFGFGDSRPFHAMNRPMRTIVFRVAMGGAQTLTLGGRRISFLSLGDPGDRITLRLADVSLASRGAEWTAGQVRRMSLYARTWRRR